MIQLVPQLKILVAVDVVDFRRLSLPRTQKFFWSGTFFVGYM